MIRQILNRWVLALRMANYKRLAKRREPERLVYQAWVAEQDAQIDSLRRQWHSVYAQMQHHPLISVVMPVYNAPLHWLNAAIESVRQQVYQEWELCIADDCSPNADVMPYLLAKAQKDSRIKVISRTINGHISEASNTAIESVTGEFIALLDQDDLLSENALLSVALAVEAQPNIGIVYSDEDKVNDCNLRESPCRKTCWCRADLLKYNCISHLGVYKTSLVRQVGGFRKGYEGAQDHDLALRCSHQLTDSQIVHIPKILYHWRIHPMSTAYMRHAKPYAQTARERTIADYLKTNGLVAFK